MGPLSDIKGVLVVTIKNVGDLDAKEVKLDAKDSGFANIAFDDSTGDVIEFTRRLEIGTILAKQTVNIVVWGKGNTFYQDGDPILTHKHGQAISLTLDTEGFYNISLLMWLTLIILVIFACVISYNSIWLIRSWRELAETQNRIQADYDEAHQFCDRSRAIFDEIKEIAMNVKSAQANP